MTYDEMKAAMASARTAVEALDIDDATAFAIAEEEAMDGVRAQAPALYDQVLADELCDWQIANGLRKA